ncbi:MAG: DNA cytosine methyltransferase [Planctomycetia bacterium]|nr:DNA cytosine methyltransferase [Planctomycetia bacterium]
MKAVDLFAGCGGLSLGFQQAGIDVVAAFESWSAAVKCYQANFEHPVLQTDLSDSTAAAREIARFAPDVIIGGPPCQDFSQAGKRHEAERADLTESFSQIVSALKPRYFVMENVDQARRSRAYAKARGNFISAGYGLTEIVLNASLCGAPQKRKRFICFGALGRSEGFAKELFESKQSRKPTTLRDYFGDSLGFQFYYRHPRNYNRRGVFSIDEPAPTMRGVNRPVPKGYLGHPKDPCPVSKNLHVLTTQERAWIQTFPPSFKWVGAKTDVEQMIGNAVPVALGKFVAEVLLAIEAEGEKTNNIQSARHTDKK